MEQRPCGQMQREGPTKPKPIAKVTYFFALLCFACAISSCIIRQRLQQSAEAAIASALQTTEQGREDAAAGWVDLTYPYPCSYPILCSRTWSSSSQRGQSTGTKLRLTKLRLTTKQQYVRTLRRRDVTRDALHLLCRGVRTVGGWCWLSTALIPREGVCACNQQPCIHPPVTPPLPYTLRAEEGGGGGGGAPTPTPTPHPFFFGVGSRARGTCSCVLYSPPFPVSCVTAVSRQSPVLCCCW